MTISGGTVTATGGDATGVDRESCGIYVDDLTISGEETKVTATGGKVTGNFGGSSGIFAFNNITISGGTVTATGGTAEYSWGIDTEYGDVAISGGSVTANGGEADESCGIYAYDDVTISGGHVIAQTLAGKSATTCAALNKAPGLDSYTGYYWRTSTEDSFTTGNYSYSDTHTYVEFYNGSTYTVTFKANGDSGETSAVTGVSGIYTLPACKFTAPEGKQFKAWSVNDTEYAVGADITVSADTTVTAIWENIPTTTCTVRFDANGGSGEMADVTVVSGSYTLPECGFTKPSGKQFKGWATSENGEVISGTSITVTEDTTLYAIWEDIPAATCDQTADFTIDDGADALALLNGAKTEGAANSTWDSTNKILTLNGVDFTTSAAPAVKLPADTTIVLAEGTTNAITSTNSDSNQSDSCGIDARGSLTIEGSGTLIVTGGAAETTSFGIYLMTGDLTIKGGTVKATGGTSVMTYGIQTDGSATISGGTVTAIGGTSTVDGSASYGIFAGEGLTINSGIVTATGSQATYSRGIGASYGQTVNITGGTVTATGGTVIATGGTAQSESNGIFAYMGNITISGGYVTAQTVSTTGEKSALNVEPDLSGYTGYQWRTSASGDFNTTAYPYDAAHTYVEFSQGAAPTTYTVRFDANGGSGEMDAVTGVSGSYTLPECGFTKPSGKQFKGWATSATGEVISGTAITVTEDTTLYAVWAIPYGVTVNDVEVTDLNKDDVLGNGLVRYNPDTNTVYKADGFLTTLTVAGNESTDVVLGGDTIAFLTVTGAKNVTGTDTDIVVEANITCTGDVTFNYEKNGLVNLIVTEAQNVTVISSYPNAPAILGYAKINCSGDVTISSANDIAVSRSLTVTAARDVTVTANTASGSSKPAIGGNADIICSGDVTISNTGGGKAVSGTLKYQNASGKHSYTVKTGDSLENLTDYATKEAGDTFTATLDAAAVKITVAHTADEWKSSSTQHWKVCTVCEIELEREDHTFSGNTCTECGYTKSSGGGSSTPTYTPSVTQPENGTVTVSPKAPKKGDTVTITPKPEAGYTVEQILVTDKDGNPVKVTNNGDGTFSFTQPAGKVNVEVTFMEDNSMLNFFVDVPAGAYYYDAVLWAAENGITGGVDDTHFAPNAPCTRAQIVTFLWRAAGSPEPENVGSFADVSADSYYAKAVAWAVENGITTGTGDGKFSPDATCTRAQAMAFLWRSQKSVAADGANPFTDVAADAYYAGAVQWAVENGITNGSGDGTTFSPNANCTRAQIVTFLFRCLGEE